MLKAYRMRFMVCRTRSQLTIFSDLSGILELSLDCLDPQMLGGSRVRPCSHLTLQPPGEPKTAVGGWEKTDVATVGPRRPHLRTTDNSAPYATFLLLPASSVEIHCWTLPHSSGDVGKDKRRIWSARPLSLLEPKGTEWDK